MNPLIGALVLVLLGVLGARLSYTQRRAPLGPRLIFSAGTHFLFLGFLLGSHILGLLTQDVIDQLYPFLALGLGWIGLLFGLQLERRQLGRFPPSYVVITLVQALLVFAIFYIVGVVVLDGDARAAGALQIALLVAAATACMSTPAGIALISHTFLVRGRVSQLVFYIASLDALVGIIALQATYSFYPRGVLAGRQPFPGGGGWLPFGLAVAFGAIFGLLFLWLTPRKPDRQELALFLLALALFAAGTALYLGLSPLFVSAAAGLVIANLSPARRRVYAMLQTWEKPIYVILLILAGARLDFPTWLILPLAAAYLLVRGLAKVVAGFLATRVAGRRELPVDLGIGLIPQGGISLAVAISMTLTYGTLTFNGLALENVVFSTVVIGVVASELIGPFLTRNLLRRAGEISPRVETAVAAGAHEKELVQAARESSRPPPRDR